MSDYEVKNVEAVVVSNDIQVRVFTLAQGDVIPWHYHSESTDHWISTTGTRSIWSNDRSSKFRINRI
jgi:quercetin dioxygenase-like cupin family protein